MAIENTELVPSGLPTIPLSRLQKRVQELRQICDQLDPYSPIPKRMQKKLAKYQINELNNPFEVTNRLLLLLEDSLEELQTRQTRQ
jgi:hypothetical protein